MVSPRLRDICRPTRSLSLVKTRVLFLGEIALELVEEPGLEPSVLIT